MREGYLDINLEIVPYKNGLALQFRRLISYCEKNEEFFKEIVAANLMGKPVTAKIEIKFKDPIKAVQKMRELGVDIEYIPVEKKSKKS